MMKRILILFSSLIFVACQNQSETTTATQTTQTTTPTPVVAKQTQGIWLDVRTAEEFAQGHLKSALNVTSAELHQKMPQLAPDKNTPIHVYCRSGRRSEEARQILLQMGYTNVVNEGGYQDLLNKGLEPAHN